MAELNTTIKGLILGKSGLGKTSLLKTLSAEETFTMSIEAGLLAVKDVPNLKENSIELDNWPHIRAVTAIFRGVDPSALAGEPYSAEHQAAALKWFAEKKPNINIEKYNTLFGDSITAASRFCMRWAIAQTDKVMTQQGKLDMRKVYGLVGQEMVNWLIQLQRIPNKDVWLVGILDENKTELGAPEYQPQLEGSATAKAIIGIFDQVITLTEITLKSEKEGESKKARGFVTQTINHWNYPAKDRSGTLDPIEPAHLGKLAEKIRTAKAKPFSFTEFLQDEIIF